MYSSVIRTTVEPRPHLMISMDGTTRHLGPQRNGCLRASRQLQTSTEGSSQMELFLSTKMKYLNIISLISDGSCS
jgi:hypothetical protein